MSSDWHADVELLEAWRTGDQRAGMRLYDRHADAVARFFENKVRESADDLIQQTFLRVVESRERIREGIALRGFILGVCRNVLREHLRSLSRKREIDPEVDSMAELAPGPTTMVGRSREHRLLLEGLRRLPVEHQVALELYYWEGLNAAQIADIMAISHSAMRSRMTKARALLREAMTEISTSQELLESTVNGLDKWAAQLREGKR